MDRICGKYGEEDRFRPDFGGEAYLRIGTGDVVLWMRL